MILLVFLLAAQAQTFTCSGTADERNCRSEDGSTFVERRLVDQTVRQGTSPNGTSWTEYLTRAFDGARLDGSDSSGRHWSQQCNPRYGTTGTNRNGASIYIPPSHVPVTAANAGRFGPLSKPIDIEQPPADACSNL